MQEFLNNIISIYHHTYYIIYNIFVVVVINNLLVYYLILPYILQLIIKNCFCLLKYILCWYIYF